MTFRLSSLLSALLVLGVVAVALSGCETGPRPRVFEKGQVVELANGYEITVPDGCSAEIQPSSLDEARQPVELYGQSAWFIQLGLMSASEVSSETAKARQRVKTEGGSVDTATFDGAKVEIAVIGKKAQRLMILYFWVEGGEPMYINLSGNGSFDQVLDRGGSGEDLLSQVVEELRLRKSAP
jgi:hypothetical protein